MPDELTFKDEAAAEYDRAAPGPPFGGIRVQ